VVTKTADFADAFARAQAAGTVAVSECQVDAEALTTGATLTAFRDAALESE
jgi:acetolactate synthase-1/2/3 large subunit